MEESAATLVRDLKNQTQTLIESEQYAEALDAANQTIEQILSSSGMIEVVAYAAALEIRGDIARNTGDYETAVSDYREAIELLQEDTSQNPLIGRLHASLGAVLYNMGDIEATAEVWQAAVRFFENSDPPLMSDVATITNNLGFLYKSQGDFDTAENCFLRSLEILHSEYGEGNCHTADVFCNLGTLYFTAGFYDQSLKMHTSALDIRKQLFSNSHPDTAQSHNNLALTLYQSGEKSFARDHFMKALQAYEELGAECAEDLVAVCNNYCEFLLNEGEPELADEAAARVRELLSQYANA
jgi:tetratricopeptide (TPR) repeat protein